MGFLDHSTNNIIVDAVLTDRGREKLAQGNKVSEFIVYYGFADDEIDYTLVKKYGTIVGKEKIEKNTPIFEASTDSETAVRYMLSTSSNPLVAQPTLELVSTQGTITKSKGSSLNISMTDTEQILDAVAYDVVYDPRYIVFSGNFETYQLKQGKRTKIVVEAGREDVSLEFKLGLEGEKVLKEFGKTKTTTSILVTASNGVSKRISVIVEYV